MCLPFSYHKKHTTCSVREKRKPRIICIGGIGRKTWIEIEKVD
jgi:hypothetical protein